MKASCYFSFMSFYNRARAPSFGNMLEILNDSLNFNNYKKVGEVLKKLIIMLIMISSMAVGYNTIENLEQGLNKVITLRGVGLAYENIWSYLGVNENTEFYFHGDDNLYECRRGEISNDTCTKVTIDFDFNHRFQEMSEIKGSAYIYNSNEDINKGNSYILAKNYILDENYSINEETGDVIDNDCVVDELNTCVVNINTIDENLKQLYGEWDTARNNRGIFNTNYSQMKTDINSTLRLTDSDYSHYTNDNKIIHRLPYDPVMLALTSKVLNDLNIKLGDYYDELYNKNNETNTHLTCEIYKLTGELPEKIQDNFNIDLCDLENTFPNNDNILRVEKRVFYQKSKPKVSTALYFNQGDKWIKGGAECGKDCYIEPPEDLLLAAHPYLTFPDYTQLTKEWSDNPVVNTYIYRKAVIGDALPDKFFSESTTSTHVWEITSIFINETFKFYENKIKAEGKIKQLMELKSIGILSEDIWQKLGFDSHKSDIKSEITVDEVLKEYKAIVEFYKAKQSGESSRKLLKDSGLNILFLAKLLKELDLEMVNGKIFNKYDSVFIKSLLQMENNQFESYKTELLAQKEAIISNLSEKENWLLKKYFKMETSYKLLEAIKTNGFTKTIPDFRTWLKEQANGVLAEYYKEFSDEHIAIIDNVLKNKKEEQLAPIRKQLMDDYLALLAKINDYSELNIDEIYSKLDNINIIFNFNNIDFQRTCIDTLFSSCSTPEHLVKVVTELKEISVLDFKYLALTKQDIFYKANTNLYHIYRPYNEIITSREEIQNLINDNIFLLGNYSKDIKNTFFEDTKSYATIAYYLSDILIDYHHSRYDLIAQIIKNLSMTENEGISFTDWVEIANDNDMAGEDVWKVLGFDKNASLSQDANKDFNIDDILINYSKLNDLIKEKLGLAINLYDEDFSYHSLFFDPITAMILSKTLVEKGYYISTGSDGYKSIFDKYDVEVSDLATRIDRIIEDIRGKYNYFGNNFGTLFDNGTLAGFLDGIEVPTTQGLSDMLGFISFSYTKNLRTGERDVGFSFGMNSINDGILWNRIHGGIGNMSSGDPTGIGGAAMYDVAKISIRKAKAIIDYTLSVAYAKQRLGEEGVKEVLNRISIERGRYTDITILGKSTKIIALLEKEHDLIMGKMAQNDLDIRGLNEIINADDTSNEEKIKASKEKILLWFDNYFFGKAAEKKEEEIKKEKDIDTVIKDVVKPKTAQSCTFEAMDESCDSGVTPAGVANAIAKLPKILLAEIDKKIRNIPPRECNVITRSCDGNSIEISAEEMQKMVNSIEAQQSADDGSCKWTPGGECSFFDETKFVPSYINLLWDPLPPFVE